MKFIHYVALLDWGPPFTLDYDGPLVDLALAEARRRCKRPEGLQWVTQITATTVFRKEASDA